MAYRYDCNCEYEVSGHGLSKTRFGRVIRAPAGDTVAVTRDGEFVARIKAAEALAEVLPEVVGLISRNVYDAGYVADGDWEKRAAFEVFVRLWGESE